MAKYVACKNLSGDFGLTRSLKHSCGLTFRLRNKLLDISIWLSKKERKLWLDLACTLRQWSRARRLESCCSHEVHAWGSLFWFSVLSTSYFVICKILYIKDHFTQLSIPPFFPLYESQLTLFVLAFIFHLTSFVLSHCVTLLPLSYIR